MRKRQQIAERFLSEWFQPEDTFALLVRQLETSRTLQRIVRLPGLMKIRSRLVRQGGPRARS
jgi:hypothetical protein